LEWRNIGHRLAALCLEEDNGLSWCL